MVTRFVFEFWREKLHTLTIRTIVVEYASSKSKSAVVRLIKFTIYTDSTYRIYGFIVFTRVLSAVNERTKDVFSKFKITIIRKASSMFQEPVRLPITGDNVHYR